MRSLFHRKIRQEKLARREYRPSFSPLVPPGFYRQTLKIIAAVESPRNAQLDTQGFDLEVVKSAVESLDYVRGLQSELSLKPIYEFQKKPEWTGERDITPLESLAEIQPRRGALRDQKRRIAAKNLGLCGSESLRRGRITLKLVNLSSELAYCKGNS